MGPRRRSVGLGPPLGRRTALAALAGTTALLAFRPGAKAQDSNAIGRIEALRGYAALFNEDGTRPAEVGGPVFPADTIQTSAGTAVEIRLMHGARLFIGPESRVEMAPLAETEAGTAMRLLFGVVRAVVERQESDPMAIEGRFAVASVRGTEFAVRQDDAQTSVVTLGGLVQVDDIAGGWSVTLAPGDGIDATGALGEAGETPPVNRWGPPRIGRIVADTTVS